VSYDSVVAAIPRGSDELAGHWNTVYATHATDEVSWYQAEPATSLALVAALGISRDAAVIDVGGGASFFADRLVERGFSDVTVLDIAEAALEDHGRHPVADGPVTRLRRDVLTWKPTRLYDLWHDRALFHFFGPDDRGRYLQTMLLALRPGGIVVLATFAPDGPDHCSGLPVVRYSADDLVGVLGDPFLIVRSQREEHTTPGGSTQPFTWYVGRRL